MDGSLFWQEIPKHGDGLVLETPKHVSYTPIANFKEKTAKVPGFGPLFGKKTPEDGSYFCQNDP